MKYLLLLLFAATIVSAEEPTLLKVEDKDNAVLLLDRGIGGEQRAAKILSSSERSGQVDVEYGSRIRIFGIKFDG